MHIKINKFSPLSYYILMRIVEAYCEKYETRVKTDNKFSFGAFYISNLEVTGKNPIKLEVGNSRYHVKCRKTKTTYVFDVWLAI